MPKLMQLLGMVIVVGLIATVYNLASVRAQRQTQTPDIVSGADLGFRVTGFDKDGRAKGEFLVRLNGQWLTAEEDHQPRAIPVR